MSNDIQVLADWVNRLTATFPTAEVVKAKDNELTIRIRYDDVFRSMYNDMKKADPEAKVSLKPCDYDKKYNMCMVVKTRKVMTGWEDAGFDKPILVNADGINVYYITLESMFKAFDTTWKRYNQGKPIAFAFETRRATTRGDNPVTVIWHYVTIRFVNVEVKKK